MTSGVIYARLSDVRKGDVEGIERQLREGRAHAERLGVEVVEELVDNDLSAAKRKTRPDFVRLMEGIAENRWEVVILRSLDRWVRRPAELEEIITTVEKSKVRIEAIHGEIDLRTRSGRLNARVVTSVAMHEVEAIQERVTDWHTDRASRGAPVHGPMGYGFNADKVTVNEPEAERIREAARRVLDGEALTSIARDWNDQGVPAPRERWRPQTIRRILTAARTAGLREHRGQVVAEGSWPAILDRVTWERVVRYLNTPERLRMAPKDRRAHLLTGIATCSDCEKGMNSKVVHGVRRYFCRHCMRRTITAAALEEHVAEDLFVRLDTVRFAAPPDGDRAEVERLLGLLAEEREKLAEHVGSGLMSSDEWAVAKGALNARREALVARLPSEEPREWLGEGSALRAAWKGMGVSQKRRILKQWIVEVKIGPAVVGRNSFDARRVDPRWRA